MNGRIKWGNVIVAVLILGLFVYGGAIALGLLAPPQLRWPRSIEDLRARAPTPQPGGADTVAATPRPAQSPAPGGRTTPAPDSGIRSEVPVPESQGNFRLGYVTIAFDKEFPPYAPVVLLYQERLAEKRGLGVRFIPFDIEDKNRFAEWRRAELLQNGGFDIMLTTMDTFALYGHPGMGKITAIIGESAGADKAVVEASTVRTFNDLEGKAFAYSDSSVSEFLLYYMLRVAGIPPERVIRFGHENLNQAVRRFLAREAHGVIGWTSEDLEQAMRRPDAKVLMTSEQFRVTLDVIVTGSRALETKPEAVQAFHDAWFEANKMVIEQPDRAAASIARWSSKYTGVASSEDLKAALSEFAQATLADNQNVFSEQNLPLLYTRFREAQNVWASGGRPPARLLREDELPQMFEPSFVRRSAQQSSLLTSRPPVNPTFHLTARAEVPKLTEAQLGRATTVVVLGVQQVVFEEGSARLSPAAQADIQEYVVPVLRNSVGTYLKIEGSAAWPAGRGLTEQQVAALALERARAVQDYIIKFGIPLDRLIVGAVLPRCRECADPPSIAQAERVTFTLITP